MNAPAEALSRSRSRRNLAKLWLNVRMPLVAVLVLGTALGGGNYAWTLYTDANTAARDAAHQSTQDDFYAAIRSPVPAWLESVDAAMAAGELPAAFEGDEAARQAAEEALAGAVSEATGVRLVPLRTRQPDDTAFPPISFATLDLARESRSSGDQPPVEVHHFGTETQHLAALRRVEDGDGNLVGHALFAFPLEPVTEALTRVPLTVGYAELSQRLDKRRPLRLASVGDRASVGDTVRHAQRLPGTRLQVRLYMPDATDAELDVLGELVPVIGGVVLLAVFGAVGGLLAVRQRRRARGRVMLGGAAAATIVDDEEAEGVFAEATARREAPAAREAVSFDVDADAPSAAGGADAGAGDLELPPTASGGIIIEDDAPEATAAASGMADSIFRAYDIRGVVGDTLDADGVRKLGQAIGTEAFEQGQQTLTVGRDGRLSSDELHAALLEGLTSTGRDVIDIGRVPTPVLYFSTYFLNTGSGVMITGSHNPPEYNGLKTMLSGDILFGDAIQNLKGRVARADFREGAGQVQTMDLLSDYIRRVTEDMPVALGNALKIVVDCGNGAASEVAPKLLRALGHDVVELYCTMDGNFPNHHPDPVVPENLQDLIAAVRDNNADVGLAFDGDGDRIGVVDDTGEIIWADRLMMLYARDVLSRHPGSPVVFDVKCTSRLRTLIEENGGQPVMDKTGHSFMRNRLHETGAQLAGELSGHIFFKERWYGFDDAMYCAARLVEILMLSGRKASELFAELPTGVTTPELRLDMKEGEHFALMERLLANPVLEGAEVFTVDGLRAEFEDGWGLVRASNTTPSLVFRFEANDDAALARIQGAIRALVEAAEPGLELPFD